jgi:hypothetical protein
MVAGVYTANVQKDVTLFVTYLVFKVRVACGIKLCSSFPFAIHLYYIACYKTVKGVIQIF